jgi:hypothetical protein
MIDRKMADIPPFGLRMRKQFKRKLEAAARANNRSLNSEIVARLELSFRQQDQQPGATNTPLQSDQEDRLRMLEEMVDHLLTEGSALTNRMAFVEARLNKQSS